MVANPLFNLAAMVMAQQGDQYGGYYNDNVVNLPSLTGGGSVSMPETTNTYNYNGGGGSNVYMNPSPQLQTQNLPTNGYQIQQPQQMQQNPTFQAGSYQDVPPGQPMQSDWEFNQGIQNTQVYIDPQSGRVMPLQRQMNTIQDVQMNNLVNQYAQQMPQGYRVYTPQEIPREAKRVKRNNNLKSIIAAPFTGGLSLLKLQGQRGAENQVNASNIEAIRENSKMQKDYWSGMNQATQAQGNMSQNINRGQDNVMFGNQSPAGYQAMLKGREAQIKDQSMKAYASIIQEIQQAQQDGRPPNDQMIASAMEYLTPADSKTLLQVFDPNTRKFLVTLKAAKEEQLQKTAKAREELVKQQEQLVKARTNESQKLLPLKVDEKKAAIALKKAQTKYTNEKSRGGGGGRGANPLTDQKTLLQMKKTMSDMDWNSFKRKADSLYASVKLYGKEDENKNIVARPGKESQFNNAYSKYESHIQSAQSSAPKPAPKGGRGGAIKGKYGSY